MPVMRLGIGLLLTSAALAGPLERLVFYERFRGSANSAGFVSRLDTSVGYNFNQHAGVDVGLPFYFVRPSDTFASTLGTGFASGLGNVYFDFRLRAPNPALNYATVLTVTAPTGDEERGFSTGNPTVDWTNHFDRTFWRVTPFANLGVANTVSDTAFFIRPFSSRGLAGHFEGGADLRVGRNSSIGASAYSIIPSGEQTVVSRVVSPGRGAGAQRVRPRPFEVPTQTATTADVVRDNGFSVWYGARPGSYLDFEVGYSRSALYGFDSVFFGVGFNVGSWVAKGRHQE